MLNASICVHGPLEIVSACRSNSGAVVLRAVGGGGYGDITIFAEDRFDALMQAFPLAEGFCDHDAKNAATAGPRRLAAEIVLAEQEGDR